MSNVKHQLNSVFVASNRQDFNAGLANEAFNKVRLVEENLTESTNSHSISVKGFCLPCNHATQFGVDLLAGGRLEGGRIIPNWRERLVCVSCRMSNRQRLMATLMMQHLQSATARKNMYLMECTTPLYQWAIKKFGSHRIVGSEYFGAQCQPGEIIKAWRYHPPFNYSQLRAAIRHQASLFYSMLRLEGVQHEDVTRLSFESDSLDLIISNDVFEHIPNPKTAFTECARVLRTGGVMLATLPFHVDVDSSITRASIADGELVNLLPPMYHGNPVSSGGSLVFTDFGWDVIEHLKQAGFSEVTIKCYSSAEFGHFGGVQIIFCLTK